jgi:hypothetical protein
MAYSKLDKQKCGMYISKCYTDSLNFQRPLFQNFNEYYRLYRGVLDQNKQSYRGRAKLFVPYIFATIETIMPRLIGSKPNIEAAPRESGDIQSAKTTTQLLSYQWDMMDMKKRVKTWCRNALMYGVGILKLTWSYDPISQKDQPSAEVIDQFDFFIDPNATTIEDGRYVIHRVYRDIEELKRNKNYDIPRELVTQVSQDEYKVQRDAVLGLSKPQKDDKKVELLEYWGKYDLEGKGEEVEALIVVANRQFPIRMEANPYLHNKKPFIDLHDTDIPNEFWSVGEVEPLVSLQYELNDVRNQRMDNVTLILNRMWKVNKGAGVNESELVSQPGGVVHTDDMNGIEPLTTPDVTASAYNEESLIKGDMQQASGVSDYTKGVGSSGKGSQSLANDTATGIMLLQEAGNARFRYKLDNLEDSLKEFGRQLIALDQQFIDTQTVVRITGEQGTEWRAVNPEDIRGEFDIQVEAGSTQPMNKSVRRAEARELLATVAPYAQTGILDLKYFIKYLMKTYDLLDVDEAFGAQQGLPGGVPGAAMEQAGGQMGAVLGGNVGNRGSVPLQTMANPTPQDRGQAIQAQAAVG